MSNVHQKKVVNTFLSGSKSATLVIPKSVAVEYGLQEPSTVVVEGVGPGYVVPDKSIVIRRVEI